LINTNHVKIGLAALMSSMMVISLLAGCGGSTTVTTTATAVKTVTASGSASTVTETKTATVGAGSTVTVTGGAGATVTTTATTTATATTTTTVTSGGGSGSGTVMGSLVVYGDTVCNVGCLQTSTAHRGELMVFRARIVDPKTGKDLIAADIKSAVVVLPDNNIAPIAMKYGKHGTDPDSDNFWAGIWEVPLNYPTGSLGYEIQVTSNDARTGNWKPFGLLTSRLTIKEFDVNFVRAWSANLTATGFSVATVSMAAGSKITFTNKDTIPHRLLGPDWDSGAIAPAGVFVKVFPVAGTYLVKDGSFTLTVTVNPV
jgi:hypothetical protein